MAIVGSTVSLTGTFVMGSTCVDPIDIELTIYVEGNETPLEVIAITTANRVKQGVYNYDYTVPSGSGNLEYEYKGTFNGKTLLNRETLPRTWKRR